jgi:hypothetical protein
MLGILFLLPDGEERPPLETIGLFGVATALWSPFVTFGLLPFVLSALPWRATLFDWSNLICAMILGIPILAYLLAGIGGIPLEANWQHDGFSFGGLAVFLTLEVGVYLLALRLWGWEHLRYAWVVGAVLLVLPLFRIGIYNDLATRASIPALTLLAIAIASSITQARCFRAVPVAILVAVGSMTSVLEILGRDLEGRVAARQQSLRSGFLSEDPAFAVQYNAPLPHWILRH